MQDRFIADACGQRNTRRDNDLAECSLACMNFGPLFALLGPMQPRAEFVREGHKHATQETQITETQPDDGRYRA